MKCMLNAFKARREALCQNLPEHSLVIIPGAREKLRNGDNYYAFRQSSDFYYLTGFNEPDAVLVLSKERETKALLFNRPSDPALERWTGPRLGQEDAVKALGVDQAYAVESLRAKLPELIANKTALYYPLEQDMGYESMIRSAWREVNKKRSRIRVAPEALKDIRPILAALRVIKDKYELDALREAQHISITAHESVMKHVHKAKHEYELEAEFMYKLGSHGCKDVAYPPIVAGGARACILHYTDNNQPLKQNDLLLIDAGAEVLGYAADITRTYPISGKFSQEQRAVYDIVLQAQEEAIKLIKPGLPWDRIQGKIVDVMSEGLRELGVIAKADELQNFYMHSSGHWLGLDVHDAGAYQLDGEPRPLEANMVLTVEPGIYIDPNCKDVDERWRGIGIRIEDDIVVTEQGYENLTEALVKKPDELEAMICG